MTRKRMFELVEGASSKFWEVWRDGSTIYTRFGKVGSGGQTKLKEEGSDEDADHAIEKQIREKVSKGWTEAGAAPATRTTHDAKDLTSQLANLPPLVDDPAYLVFADWLQGQGNPWGELIALQHAARIATNPKKRDQLDTAVAAFLEQHRAAIIGPAASNEYSRFEWHLGFLRAATIATPPDPTQMLETLATLLAQPVAHMMTGVVLSPIPVRFETKRDWDAASENIVDPWTDLNAIAKQIPKRITHLGFGGWPAPAASAYVQMPSYTALSENFAHLRRLELTGSAHSTPGTLAMPNLVDLEVRFADGGDLAAITDSNLSKLERVSVWLGGSSYCILDDVYPHEDGGYPSHFDDGDLESLEVHDVSSNAGDIEGFIDALPSTVKHLGIQSTGLTADVVAQIISRPRMKLLKTLDLSGGTLDDATAKILIGSKKSLAHLAMLNLERNRIGAATAKKLAAALPKARVGNQRKTAQPDLFFRYVAVME